MINVTLEDLLVLFTDSVTALEAENDKNELVDDAEYNFLRIIAEILETTSKEFDNFNLSEEVKLSVAASRIPGLLYLYQLY